MTVGTVTWAESVILKALKIVYKKHFYYCQVKYFSMIVSLETESDLNMKIKKCESILQTH